MMRFSVSVFFFMFASLSISAAESRITASKVTTVDRRVAKMVSPYQWILCGESFRTWTYECPIDTTVFKKLGGNLADLENSPTAGVEDICKTSFYLGPLSVEDGITEKQANIALASPGELTSTADTTIKNPGTIRSFWLIESTRTTKKGILFVNGPNKKIKRTTEYAKNEWIKEPIGLMMVAALLSLMFLGMLLALPCLRTRSLPGTIALNTLLWGGEIISSAFLLLSLCGSSAILGPSSYPFYLNVFVGTGVLVLFFTARNKEKFFPLLVISAALETALFVCLRQNSFLAGTLYFGIGALSFLVFLAIFTLPPKTTVRRRTNPPAAPTPPDNDETRPHPKPPSA